MTLHTSHAVYNLHNDQLLLYLDSNYIPTPADKVEFKTLMGNLGKAYGPGRKVIYGRWTPTFEDLCIKQGHEIEFICEPDDSEARAERYAKYAEHADADSLSSRDRWMHANTARRDRIYSASSISKSEKSEYWFHKVAAVVQHANHVEKLSSIQTKLDVVKKDINAQKRWLPEYKGKGSRYSRYPELVVDVAYYTKQYGVGHPDTIRAVEKLTSVPAYRRRYAEHLCQWQEYLQMYLEASGVSVIEKVTARRKFKPVEGNPLCQKGGAYNRGTPTKHNWVEITRVNATTISIICPSSSGRGTYKTTEIKTSPDEYYMTKEAYARYQETGIPEPGK